jgi:hypothetical protein
MEPGTEAWTWKDVCQQSLVMFLRVFTQKQEAQDPKLGPESRKPVRKVGETKDRLVRK